MDIRGQQWYLQVDTHFCRQVQLSPAHAPRRCEIDLPILWSTWKPFICMATCLTQQQCWGAGSTSSDLSVCNFTLLHFCVADHWPGAQAELTWPPGKKLCKHSLQNSFWKIPCYLPLIHKSRTHICDSFERAMESITVPWPFVTALWLNPTYVCFCAQVTETTIKVDKNYCDWLHIVMNSNHVIQLIHTTQLQTHKPW